MRVRRLPLLLGIASLAFAGATTAVLAQGGSGDQGPVDGASFEVNGVEVDVKGANAEAARQGGWRIAQRKGWEMLSKRLTGKAQTLPDSVLDSLVSGIVVEREEIGPTRYIARLGVLFDRARAGGRLGVSTRLARSQPMLLVPVQYSGGVGTTFERNTAWQSAWDRFRVGNSSVDYIRLQGTGPDALLINAAQAGRRGRGWWREILQQYGAGDVLVAEVRLTRSYPGGPVTGTFTASHGPDKIRITQFSLRVDSPDAIGSLLDEGIRRIDSAYEAAFSAGALKADPLLGYRPPVERVEEPEEDETPGDATPIETPTAVETTASYSVQVETPNTASFNAAESAFRGIPGVRGSSTTSLALGGVSVMRVTYDGSIGSLAAALEARGWSVQEGAGVLRIRRGGGGNSPAPAPSPSGAPSGE